MKTNTHHNKPKNVIKPLASLARFSWNLSRNTGKAHKQHLQTYVSQCLAAAQGAKHIRSIADVGGLSQEFLNSSIDYGHRSLNTNLSASKSYSNWFRRRSEACTLSRMVNENNEDLILY